MHLKSLVFFAFTSICYGEWVNLWDTEAPGGTPRPAGSELVGKGGRLTDIENPQIWAYLPEKKLATRAAVVIFPGGGYGLLAADHEGHDYAKWLAARGVAAYVVKYRVSSNPALGYQFPIPFIDARRALRTVRAKSAEWGIDPKKIGVMGSSAGGHLASLCATHFADSIAQETHDEIDLIDCRPDFAILIYPVIAMSPPLAHSGSRKNLLGDNPSMEIADNYSTAKSVTPATPPVFMVSTSDDSVDCRNSLEFATACKANKVPFSLHLFETGGHGYGMRGKTTLAAWPMLLEQWLTDKFPAGM